MSRPVTPLVASVDGFKAGWVAACAFCEVNGVPPQFTTADLDGLLAALQEHIKEIGDRGLV